MVKKKFKTWGERLFPPPVVGRVHKLPKEYRPIKVSVSKPVALKSALKNVRRVGGLSPQKKAELLIKKAPEVMVKISGASKGMSKLRNHVDYISRNGNVELEDQQGNVYFGRGSVEDTLLDWQENQNIPNREKEGRRREALHVILSMPANTDRDNVKNAARDFAKQAFGNHDWFMAEHRDEAHPHVHFVVKMADDSGKRLNPRKADLQLWRENFAKKLNEHGIEANATPRPIRGKTRRPKSQAQYHAIKNKRPLKTDQIRRREVVEAAKAGQGIVDAAPLVKARQTRENVLENGYGFVDELKSQGHQKLSKDLKAHFDGLEPVESEQQAALREYKARQKNTAELIKVKDHKQKTEK